MCTLSYYFLPDGYQLFFNRDEQRSRPLAIPPKFDDEIQAIYPTDPKAGGTWMGVSLSGVSIALLNLYQADQQLPPPDGSEVSRGQLVLLLLSLKDNVEFYLQQMDLTCYRPFEVLLMNTDRQAQLYRWDGKVLSHPNFTLPITSSSVDINKVIASRRQQYHDIVAGSTDPELHQQFHLSKVAQGHRSVNMSRADARTMSISSIRVTQDEVVFDYLDNVTKTRYRRQARRC